MKKAPHRSMFQSSRGKQDSTSQRDLPGKISDKNQHKTHSVQNYFKAASRKLAGVFTILLFRKRKKGNTNDNKTNNQVKTLSFSSSTDHSTGSDVRSSARLKSFGSYGSSTSASGHIPTPDFSFEDICKATGNFSEGNKIGEGRFGTVYKGRLKDGSLVAVKRTKKDKYEEGLSLQFKNEILALSKIEHRNLVRLFGFMEHRDEQIIVVEYVGNGNLREHLDGVRGNGLEIAERLDIAIDVAHALTYLHTYTDPPIIHRDIKASNILITEKLRAKVADFGFARLALEDPAATHISTQVKGTAGYVDPEYTRTYQLTEKSDVYSFGVLLVELMTGRYPIESKRPVKERITIRWAMKSLNEGEFVIAMDPRLRRSPASNMVVEKVLKLAHQCLAPVRQSRPSMKNCAEVLWGIRKNFKEKASSSSSSASHYSANFPDIDARNNRHLFGIEEDESYRFISA
ncbi:calmodulin-binding receptor-like cytoplasmic kinase 1 [Durio zibethinus]|uniref:non-specific serine/threonine protein kinase n=1 Tax=Durio zibethinus TaxID=66656 RepID=A0A6P5ZTX6_DURZI|nr:calmodulin-binding receptor-like cytoplasmic kinase 1 [Durio zibethinus]